VGFQKLERAAGRENYELLLLPNLAIYSKLVACCMSLMGFSPPLGYIGDGWLDSREMPKQFSIGKSQYFLPLSHV